MKTVDFHKTWILWQTHWSSWAIQEISLSNVCWLYQLRFSFFLLLFFPGFVRTELIKLAGMAGVMHEADHAYSIRSTWWLQRLATDVPSIACLINWQSIFVYNLDLSNFLQESGLSYSCFYLSAFCWSILWVLQDVSALIWCNLNISSPIGSCYGAVSNYDRDGGRSLTAGVWTFFQ